MDSQVGLLGLLLTLPLLAGLMVSHTNQETRDGLPGRSSWTVINPSLASRFDGLLSPVSDTDQETGDGLTGRSSSTVILKEFSNHR